MEGTPFLIVRLLSEFKVRTISPGPYPLRESGGRSEIPGETFVRRGVGRGFGGLLVSIFNDMAAMNTREENKQETQIFQ